MAWSPGSSHLIMHAKRWHLSDLRATLKTGRFGTKTLYRKIGLFQDPDAVDCSGNVLLDRFVGAKIVLVPPLNYEGSVVNGVRMKGLKHKMLEYMEKLRYIYICNIIQ